MITKTCDFCHLTFQPLKNCVAARQRFCSKQCHTDFWLADGNKSGKIMRFQSRKGEVIRATKSLSPLQKQICLGALLGDGSIDLSRAGSASLRMQQCAEQKGYLEWKKNLLKDFIIRDKPTICRPTGFSKRNSFLYQSVTHQDFQALHSLFYVTNDKGKRVKVLKKEVLDQLGAVGLLIWFLDDGCTTVNQVRIHTNCFTLEEHDLILSFLSDKFNINAKVYFLKSQNQWITVLNKAEAEKMFLLFSTLTLQVPSCMTYKLSFHRPLKVYSSLLEAKSSALVE